MASENHQRASLTRLMSSRVSERPAQEKKKSGNSRRLMLTSGFAYVCSLFVVTCTHIHTHERAHTHTNVHIPTQICTHKQTNFNPQI